MSTPMTQGQRLAADAAAAAEVRSYQTDPDVVALRVERIRAQVERLMWTGMVLGLCFTMVNVQQFAAAGAAAWSLAWCAAWLLDPMVSLVLLGVLRAEQITARWQVPMGPWPRVAKWSLLSATYVMNTWSSWAAGAASGIVLHSVPVLTVFVAAEAVTDCQDKLTECVHGAHAYATERAEQRAKAKRDKQAAEAAQTAPSERADLPTTETGAVGMASESTAAGPDRADEGRAALVRPQSTAVRSEWGAMSADSAPTRPARPVPAHRATSPARRRKPARKTTGGRVLFPDYLVMARRARTAETEVTPAWVREVTGCSRGLSSRLAAELRTEYHPTTDQPATSSADRPERSEGKAA